MADLTITWLGTASVLFATPAARLLVDPYVELPGAETPNRLEDFLGADALLITHAHLDHLASVPALLRRESPAVYCTRCAAELLAEAVGPRPNITVIQPEDRFPVGDIQVTVYPGKHILFDKALVRQTLRPSNLARNPKNVPRLLRENRHFQENGETVFYELAVQSLRVQVMGSLALRDEVAYPAGADVLLLPYQGSSDLVSAARAVVERLQPAHIILTHFDNAFPPVSQTIPTGGFTDMIRREYPHIAVTKPVFAQPIHL